MALMETQGGPGSSPTETYEPPVGCMPLLQSAVNTAGTVLLLVTPLGPESSKTAREVCVYLTLSCMLFSPTPAIQSNCHSARCKAHH